jgi:hypothetical protein
MVLMGLLAGIPRNRCFETRGRMFDIRPHTFAVAKRQLFLVTFFLEKK